MWARAFIALLKPHNTPHPDGPTWHSKMQNGEVLTVEVARPGHVASSFCGPKSPQLPPDRYPWEPEALALPACPSPLLLETESSSHHLVQN